MFQCFSMLTKRGDEATRKLNLTYRRLEGCNSRDATVITASCLATEKGDLERTKLKTIDRCDCQHHRTL